MPQSGPDLVGGGYPISRPLTSLLGGASNTAQANVGVRTNLDYGLGLNWSDSGALATGVAQSTPVPVVPGDVITKVTFLTGASAASNNAHSWVALYAGAGSAPALIGQTSDVTASYAYTAASVLSAGSLQPLTYTFSTPQNITSLNAPYGFIYVSQMQAVTSGCVSTLLEATVGSYTASVLRIFAQTTTPLFYTATHGTALGSAAEPTLGSTSAAAATTKAPIVFLW